MTAEQAACQPLWIAAEGMGAECVLRSSASRREDETHVVSPWIVREPMRAQMVVSPAWVTECGLRWAKVAEGLFAPTFDRGG
jgi:hypothetical protein